MLDFFSIKNIFLTWQGYEMSYLELVGTIFGLWAVALSTQEKVSSWYIGILNVVCLFFLFYQIQLYSDMFLQVYFFVTNLLGWYLWTHPKENQENNHNQLKISILNKREKINYFLIILFFTAICTAFIKNIHALFPKFFQQPAAFPLWDTFVLVASIAAQYLLTKKKLEAWVLWIVVDIVATIIYFQKGILLLSIEYFIFTLIAVWGFLSWQKNVDYKENTIK